MPSPDRHHFIPKDELEIRRPMPGGGGMPMPMGTNTGDLLVWNATTGAWEVLAKPAGAAILVADVNGLPTWLEISALSRDAAVIADVSAGVIALLERPATGGSTTYLTADRVQDDIHWEII